MRTYILFLLFQKPWLWLFNFPIWYAQGPETDVSVLEDDEWDFPSRKAPFLCLLYLCVETPRVSTLDVSTRGEEVST